MKFSCIQGILVLLMVLFLMTGCAGRQAFMKGEELQQQGRYDAAVEQYAKAAFEAPHRQEYRMKLMGARHRAALDHLEKGRRFASQGDTAAAMAQYRHARAMDPELWIADQELKSLQERIQVKAYLHEARTLVGDGEMQQAQDLVQKALELSPSSSEARALLELIKENRRPLMDGYELDIISDEPITLKFRETEIKEVFKLLSTLSGVNFIFDEDLRSTKISVLLEDASFAQALELLLTMNNLGKKVLNSKTIVIYPRSKDKENLYLDQVIQTFYLSNIDAKKAVNLLRTILQLRKIYVHEELNALVIRDVPDVIQLAQQVLEAADRADSEVVFDLELVEVNHTDGLTFGPKLNPYQISLGMTKNGEIVSSGLDGDNLLSSLNGLKSVYTLPTAAFDFAKEQGDSEILANPKIRVKNREKSSVHVGTREPVITVTSVGETTSENIQYVDVGVKLKVEPIVQLDGTVITKLDLEVSSVTDRKSTSKGSIALTISTTNAQTALTLRDGERTVIGGLIRDNSSKSRTSIPLLGDLPLIGDLLSHHQKNGSKREILLSITPHIVRNLDLPRAEVASIWSGGEDNLKAGPSFESFSFEPVTDAPQALPVPANLQDSAAEAGDDQRSTDEVSDPTPLNPQGSELKENLGEGSEKFTGGEQMVIEEDTSDGNPSEEQVLNIPPAPSEQPVTEDLGLVSLMGRKQVAAGEEFTLDVTVQDVHNLYNASTSIHYDKSRMTFLRAEEGEFLRSAGASTLFSASSDLESGKLNVGYRQGPGGRGGNGSGVLYRVIFRADSPGLAPLTVTRVGFQRPDGTPLTVAAADTLVEIH